MDMHKIMRFGLWAALCMAVTSCSKTLGELSADNFTVTPTPLEAIAGQVPVTINGTFPEKYMKKKAVVKVTPVLKYDVGEAKGQSASFQGEKVESNNRTISYKAGGTYTMKALFDYVPDMIESDLYVQFDAKLGSKTVTIPEVKIGYGVISTSDLLYQVLPTISPAIASDAYQRIIAEKQEANIKFLIEQSNIRNTELTTDNMQAFVARLKQLNDERETKALKNIEVSAYASPDGSLDLNTRLAEARQNSSEKYLRQQLKSNNLSSPIDVNYTAEDWEGFQQLVAASNIQDKDLILRVLSMYNDPEEREEEIKNISEIYEELAEQVLPELRRARLTINYETIGRSDEQITAQYAADPTQLSLEELLYGANLQSDSDKVAWYKSATVLYPNDYRAYNNLGVISYQNADLVLAKTYFNNAKSFNGNAPEVNANLALVALNESDITTAETYLGKGTNASNYNEVSAALNIAKGNYAQAAASAKGINSNTAGLALILNKDYASAQTALSNVADKDGCTYYLAAIAAARTQNDTLVKDNLKAAVEADWELKERAGQDLEFVDYQSVVEGL